MSKKTSHPAIVFLDIDGVLNHQGVYDECFKRPGQTRKSDWLDPLCIERLNGLCERTGAVLVITSGWRRYLDGFSEVETVLKERGLTAKIVGQIPNYLHDLPGNLSRETPPRWREISDWLASRTDIGPWVILDDTVYVGFPTERFVKTDIAVGLTDEDILAAEAILRRS